MPSTMVSIFITTCPQSRKDEEGQKVEANCLQCIWYHCGGGGVGVGVESPQVIRSKIGELRIQAQ